MTELERRRAPRSLVAMDCTLTRRIGSPIAATTVDLGSGGMSVATPRPLAVDEELGFALLPLPFPLVSGRARVVRDQGGDVYALRFEPSA
jgi:PilZ domain